MSDVDRFTTAARLRDPVMGEERGVSFELSKAPLGIVHVTLCGDDDRGITERAVSLPESTPAWPGDCPWCPEQPDDTCTTLGAIARGEVDCHHRARDGRLLPCLWLTAEQSPTGDATWWDGYVCAPEAT